MIRGRGTDTVLVHWNALCCDYQSKYPCKATGMCFDGRVPYYHLH